MDLTQFGVEGNSNAPKEVKSEGLDIDFDKIKKDFEAEDIERFLPWFLKYKVEKFDDLIVTKEIKKIIDFFEKPQKKNGLLLFGRAGSGKTTTLTLICEKYGFELFELNASDARNKKSIAESIGDVVKVKSLFGKEKLILIDEVDGVSGTKDRGGVAEIIKILKGSPYKMVFTANDGESDKIKALKKVCVPIDFENHSEELLFSIAKKIFESENIEFDEKVLNDFILERETFDIRGFINDLQASVFEGKFVVDNNLEVRNYKKKIDALLNKVFYSYGEDAYRSNFSSEISLDDLFLYLEENAPNVLSKKALHLAFNEMAKADIFKGRIMKWQYWRYLAYVNFYLTFGVSTVKGEDVKGLKTFKRNDRILKKWIYGNTVGALTPRTKIQKSKDEELKLVEVLADKYKCSNQVFRVQVFPYLALNYQKSEDFREKFDLEFELDDKFKKVLMSFR